MHGEIFSSLGVIFKEKLSFENCKISGGKSANELIHSLLNFEFLNPCCTKSIQYIRPIFTDRVNRTMTFQYSELIYL